jgi:ATP-dependent DNA helicase RecG
MPQHPDPRSVMQRVLLLERRQGYANRAAVGGLSAFTRQQAERADVPARTELERVGAILNGYAGADRPEREDAVSRALEALLTGEGGARATPAPASAARVPVATPQRAPGTSPARSLPRRSDDAGGAAPSEPAVKIVRAHEELASLVGTVKGVRRPTIEALAKVGVVTIDDLIRYFPRAHYDYADTRSISRMRVGQKTTLVGTIVGVRLNRTKRGATITTATVADDTGRVAVRWFNQTYLTQKLPVGARIAISGEPEVHNGYITFQPRDYELIEDADLTHTARLVPIYPLTKGLFQRSLRALVRRVVEEYSPALEDYLPSDMRRELRLPDLDHAVRQYHFPADEEQKAWAEQRLAFDELLLVQLGLLMRKRDWQQTIPGVAISTDAALHSEFEQSLPFQLTSSQRRVIAEILGDMERPIPMSRLLEGDVGSGKTVVAAAALLQVARAQRQAVLMAPTEILAEQHFRTLKNLLDPLDARCELLIGSTPRVQRKSLYEEARDGAIHVLIGTHALIQEGLELRSLGLAITDEQHRFGVEQRATLREKGLHPHILAMTATPIPRTLAMTIYGDLDVSVIDEMPPGRLPVVTTWARSSAEAYGVVRDEVRKGRQAFVICPVIEETAESDMRSVMAEHRELSHLTFPDLQVGLLHGRMKPREKDKTLEAFRRGEYHVLVATSVVEVGIDVPNATVMVIIDAHRFGLAQLHQFRGRVGRGGDQAFCVLLSANEGDAARERLEALTATENGFELAEEDLRLRGPGEFWGTRQSGLPALRIAQLGDVPTIQLARRAAIEVLRTDPDLATPTYAALRSQVERFWSERADLS